MPLSVVIPSYRRERVLIETLRAVLALDPPPAELIVCDQTAVHEAEVESELSALEANGRIRRIRIPKPSIPRAMNAGLLEAREEVVLFLDDDVLPAPSLLESHLAAHQHTGTKIVAGQVLQPGELPENLSGERFRFNSTVGQAVGEVIGCNFSVDREAAVRIGGFDENFVGAAYRFEREFCERAIRGGFGIIFVPSASVHHLRAPSGGTRAYGDHLRTFHPAHSVGEYYQILVSRLERRKLRAILSRLSTSVRTRHHLRHPWWIPATLLAEASGLAWAIFLTIKGPTYPARPGHE